jgi:hypothetical protein
MDTERKDIDWDEVVDFSIWERRSFVVGAAFVTPKNFAGIAEALGHEVFLNGDGERTFIHTSEKCSPITVTAGMVMAVRGAQVRFYTRRGFHGLFEQPKKR